MICKMAKLENVACSSHEWAMLIEGGLLTMGNDCFFMFVCFLFSYVVYFKVVLLEK